MHKDFYASGFLYHPRSQQILLQQQNTADNDSEWTLFEGESAGEESGEEVLKRVVHSLLHLDLKPKAIFPIYKYFHEELKKDHYISYAMIGKLEKFAPSKNIIFGWFSFKQTVKLNLSEQAKHDLVVAQRVIDSATRKKMGQQTIG